MKIKTTIRLPAELLVRIDRAGSNRSAFLEKAARAHLAGIERQERDRKDIEIINRNAARLNRAAKDVLDYQRIP